MRVEHATGTGNIQLDQPQSKDQSVCVWQRVVSERVCLPERISERPKSIGVSMKEPFYTAFRVEFRMA